MVVTPGCTRFDDPSSFSPVYVHQISQRCNRLICGEQNPTNHLGRTFGPKMRPTSYSSVADDITIRNVSLMNYANSLPAVGPVNSSDCGFLQIVPNWSTTYPRLHGILCAAVRWSFHDSHFTWKMKTNPVFKVTAFLTQSIESYHFQS